MWTFIFFLINCFKLFLITFNVPTKVLVWYYHLREKKPCDAWVCVSVMEALKKKHQEELVREVEKVKRLSSGALDSQTLRAQQQYVTSDSFFSHRDVQQAPWLFQCQKHLNDLICFLVKGFENSLNSSTAPLLLSWPSLVHSCKHVPLLLSGASWLQNGILLNKSLNLQTRWSEAITTAATWSCQALEECGRIWSWISFLL